MGKFNSTSFKLDTREFTKSIRALAVAKNKSVSDVVNKKLYYVARKAVWWTQVANYEKIAQAMGQEYKPAGGRRAGSFKMVKYGTYANTSKGAPLAAILVNYYRGMLGKKGLHGAAMKIAVQKMVGARLRSIGFLKAGWIAARDTLKRLAKIQAAPAGSLDASPKRFGVARLGSAVAASPSRDKAYARIENRASYGNRPNKKRGGEPYGHDAALMKYALPALRRAFDDETKDTVNELEKELKKTCKRLGIRTA